MKAFLFLLLLPCAANAQQGVQVMHEVAQSTNTITQTIKLCVADAIAVDVAARTSSGTLQGAFAIEAYNPAASTSTINCGFDIATSSTVGNIWYGREVSAGNGVLFQVLASVRKLYCLTQNAGGCTYLTVTQFK